MMEKIKFNQKFMKIPKDIESAKKVCKEICKEHKIKITFDDKFKNFGSDHNMAVCFGDSIDCAYYDFWNYDLLVISVLHEIGHIMESNYQKELNNTKGYEPEVTDPMFQNKWMGEYDAWHFAMMKYLEYFGQNISIRQSRFILRNLNSYIPSYDDCVSYKDGIREVEGNFWCPLKKRIMK